MRYHVYLWSQLLKAGSAVTTGGARSCKCKFFSVYGPYKESISEEMNNDNDLNLHNMTRLSRWLRY